MAGADIASKKVMEEPEDSIGGMQKFEGKLSELDKLTGACKLTIGTGERLSGVISEPELSMPGNVYVRAFYEDAPILLSAKAQIDKDGSVVKLFVSDAALRPQEVPGEELAEN